MLKDSAISVTHWVKVEKIVIKQKLHQIYPATKWLLSNDENKITKAQSKRNSQHGGDAPLKYDSR